MMTLAEIPPGWSAIIHDGGPMLTRTVGDWEISIAVPAGDTGWEWWLSRVGATRTTAHAHADTLTGAMYAALDAVCGVEAEKPDPRELVSWEGWRVESPGRVRHDDDGDVAYVNRTHLVTHNTTNPGTVMLPIPAVRWLIGGAA